MVELEGPHFTTEVFLAMHGHDMSAAYPLESRIVEDARELLGHKYSIEHTDLEQYWAELEKHLDMEGVKHHQTLKCKLGNQIQRGGIPLDAKWFEPK